MNNKKKVFNPDYNPNGAEGSLDTNKLPWIPLRNVDGLSIKPVRDLKLHRLKTFQNPQVCQHL